MEPTYPDQSRSIVGSGNTDAIVIVFCVRVRSTLGAKTRPRRVLKVPIGRVSWREVAQEKRRLRDILFSGRLTPKGESEGLKV